MISRFESLIFLQRRLTVGGFSFLLNHRSLPHSLFPYIEVGRERDVKDAVLVSIDDETLEDIFTSFHPSSHH